MRRIAILIGSVAVAICMLSMATMAAQAVPDELKTRLQAGDAATPHPDHIYMLTTPVEKVGKNAYAMPDAVVGEWYVVTVTGEYKSMGESVVAMLTLTFEGPVDNTGRPPALLYYLDDQGAAYALNREVVDGKWTYSWYGTVGYGTSFQPREVVSMPFLLYWILEPSDYEINIGLTPLST